MSYFIGRGDVYLASRHSVTGAPQGFTFLGNSPELIIYPNAAFNRFATGTSLTSPGPLASSGDVPMFDLVLDEVLKENLGLFLHGKHTQVSGATKTISITARVGKFVPVDDINLTSLVVTGYTEGVDYTTDLDSGGITVLSTGSIVEGATLSVQYTFGTYNKVGMHTTAQPYYWLRLNGINVGDSNSPVVVDIFKVRLGPPDKLVLIGDDFVSMMFKAKMYYDNLLPDIADVESEGKILRIRSVLT